MGTRSILCTALFLLLSTSVVHSQVGFTAGTEYGIGLVTRIGPAPAKIEIGGGLAPLFVFVDVTYGSDITKLYFPATIGAKLSFRVTDTTAENRLGIKLGANYNTLLGGGFGGGVDFEFNKDPVIVLGGGLMVFPEAEGKIRVRINEDEHTHYSESEFSAPLAIFQPFVSISILFGR
jgi:hypothetical protein